MHTIKVVEEETENGKENFFKEIENKSYQMW